jgi:16S rRNA (uracil1498-N3)-methyltransferase
MPRFYLPRPLSLGTVVALPEPLVRHLHVLRLEDGAHLTLFNGEGGEVTACLRHLDRRHAEAELKTFSPREAELPYALTLAQALPEASKMDWIIEKAVELGVTAFEPLAAQRSVVKLSSERAERRGSHWEAVIVAACEQCGRNRLPHLSPPAPFMDWVLRQNLHRRVLLTPRGAQSLSDWARHHPPQALVIAIGPEGGFSDEEEAHAERHGMLALSLGERVLRTETAGLAAVAGINAIWGQL